MILKEVPQRRVSQILLGLFITLWMDNTFGMGKKYNLTTFSLTLETVNFLPFVPLMKTWFDYYFVFTLEFRH